MKIKHLGREQQLSATEGKNAPLATPIQNSAYNIITEWENAGTCPIEIATTFKEKLVGEDKNAQRKN